MTDVVTIAAITIALVDAVKRLAPEQVHGLVTIVLAVLVGVGLSFITLPLGVVAALSAVGVITVARNVK